MTTSDLVKGPWQRFILDLFRIRDEQPQCDTGPLAAKKADFSQEDLLSFAQSDQALTLTKEYVKQIIILWEASKDGNEIVIKKIEPVFPEPAAAPAPDMPTTTALEGLRGESVAAEPVEVPSTLSAPETNSGQSVGIPIPKIQKDSPVRIPVSSNDSSAVLNQSSRPGFVPASGNQSGKAIPVKINFHIPNAKAGQPFAGRLDGKDAIGRALKILGVKIAPEVGLTFDLARSELRGVPVIAGEHKISIRWTAGDGVTQTAECVLIVNPDPKSLWKNTDPPGDDPYFKANVDSAIVTGGDFRVVAASRRGRSHEHVGSPRDDDFFIRTDPASGWSVLIVADGAGSAKNSRWGSKLAVKAVGDHVYSMITTDFGSEMSRALGSWSTDMAAASKAMYTPFYLLFQDASKRAVQAIENEAQAKGALPKDYSTTLLVAVTKREGNETFLATFWMGDGAIAAYGPRGKVRLMGTPDGGEFAGQTRFLDSAALKDPNFGKRVGLGRFAGLKGVILMTDGVSDPRFETDNGLADASKWDSLWDEVEPCLNAAEPDIALIEWLHFFTPGHHDDRTISILW